jgi:hypothetical protein
MAQISRPFQNAVKAMVQARVPAWQYHFGGVQVPSEQLEYPYLVQWPVPAVNDARFVACGRDIDEVLWGLDEVAAALIGQRPDIEGWACGFIRALPGETAPVAENKDILFDGRPTYMSWAHYRMTAEPAPVTAS